MPDQDKRRSERAIPFVSDEDVVIIHRRDSSDVLAKMMDLSEVGSLVYLFDDVDIAGSAELSLYQQGKIFRVSATIIRKNGRLVAFDFGSKSEEAAREIRSKLIRMEVEWMRISDRR